MLTNESKKFVVDYYKRFIWYNSNQYSQGHLSRWINLQFLFPLQFNTLAEDMSLDSAMERVEICFELRYIDYVDPSYHSFE